MLIHSLLVTVYIAVGIDGHPSSFIYDKCGLTPKENVDWSQISSSGIVWYLSFKSPDAISSKVVSCQVIKNITNDLEGSVKFHLKNYYYSGSQPKEFVVAAFKTGGTAAYRGIQDEKFIEADSQVSCHLRNKAAKEEVESIEKGNAEMIFATDYLTYFISIVCDIHKGIQWIAGYTSTKFSDS
ncbi:uncharacterized protein LOC120344057 [Styela clava]